MLLRLAIRNLLRQKIRTAMTLTAIVFGVAGLIVSGGFVQDIFVQLGESIIHSQTGHVQVFRKDFREKGTRQPENYLIPEPDALAARIAALPEVKEVSMRLSFAGVLNNGRRDLGIVGEGIEPDKEARLGTALEILAGRQLRDDDLFGAVIGQGVAHSMSLEVGDQIVLVLNTAEGAVNTLDFEVVGIFQSFSKEFDARAVRIPLAAARELLYTDGANMLVSTLHRTEDTARAYAAISTLIDPAMLEAFDWKMLSDFYEKTLGLYERQFGVLQGIILVMVLLSVANSVNMAAFERQAEFGTMQALGNTRRTVFRLLIVENVTLGVAGALLGCVIGIMLALTISAVGIPMPPPPNANVGYTAMIRVVPSVVAGAFAIALVATTLAAIFPARRVGTTPIVELLRQGN
ncbi:MAG TPA: ABC transporter permease [Rhodocyclaceae bacterium]|nr:ABC transporter permease [Rhodocyclaceae bacterium]